MKSCKNLRKELLLYAVTDRTWLREGESLYDQCEEAIKGNITMLQLREKKMDEECFYREAMNLKKLCNESKVPLIINDNVEVCLKADADGIHVGQSDMKASEVRKRIGEDKILGVSAQTVEQAVVAEREGADYLGVGAVFKTDTKDDADYVTFETLKEICEAVDIPVVAIGGITRENCTELKGSNIVGISVVSEIFSAKNIEEETRELYKTVKGIIE